ncbi:uncharacterized protein LOC110853719 [Folsomia candida]|uniref:uncharacterized protein LOC110853719 n=1 Tax=Folsomia candida TaxID=158441 RepID=UPI000B907335|nr:uncharacterized protein LOC110853719 [Folsomia candida]
MELDKHAHQSKYQLYSGNVIKSLTVNNLGKLYPHQIKALLAVKAYFDSSPNIPEHPALVVAPTGAGKSGIISLLPYVLGSAKAFVLSPSLCITDQLEKTFGLKNENVKDSFVFEIGLVKEEDLNGFLERGLVIRNATAPVNMKWSNLVIVNAQKFSTRSSCRLAMPTALQEDCDEEIRDMKAVIKKIQENFMSFTTLIVDEAHHYPASTWDLIVKEFKGKQIVFLTATPYRGSGKDPLWKGQEITHKINQQTLIDNNTLRPIEFREVKNSEIPWSTNFGESDWQLKKLERIILEIINDHDRQVPGVQHKAMVLVNTIAEAEDGSAAMDRSTYYTSQDGTQNLRAFENGLYRILFVCGRLLEGYDNSEISVCVILRNVGSPGIFTQFVGRCIRTNPKDGSDTVTAVVLSPEVYKQQKNFNEYKNYNGLI